MHFIITITVVCDEIYISQAFEGAYDKLKCKYFKSGTAAEDENTWPTDYAVKYQNKK